MKPAESPRTSDAYLRDPRRPDGAAGRRAGSRREDREEHETCLPAELPTSNSFLLGCIPFYSFKSVQRTDRASDEIHMHVFTHTANHTHTTHLPPAQHTRFSFLSCFFLWSTLSVLFFFLSHYLCLLLPSLFQYPLSFSRLHMQSASLRSPHLPLSLSLPPSIPLPLTQPLPPSPLLSLFSVCRARGHYLSHSGHVRWNGGVCSEQKRRELWGRVASSGSLGNSTVQQSSYQ